MTPEGKTAINSILQPHDAELATTITEGQDIRFVKIVTRGPSEDPLNVLDSAGYMLHAEETISRDRSRTIGRPLLRIISIGFHSETRMNVLSLEDVHTQRMENDITPPRRGQELSGVREPRRPVQPPRSQQASVYPPGHPSLTGRIV